MADDARFSFEIISGTEIHITHVGEGHRYVVTIVKDRRERRTVSPDLTMGQGSFQHSPLAFRHAAYLFASDIASKAGLIDAATTLRPF